MVCCNLIVDKIMCVRVEWGSWIWRIVHAFLLGLAMHKVVASEFRSAVCFCLSWFMEIADCSFWYTKRCCKDSFSLRKILFANASCLLAFNCPFSRPLSILPFYLCPFLLIFPLLYACISSVLFPTLYAFYLISRCFPLPFFLLLFISFVSSFWFFVY
jgi:hypothetical protein